MRFRDKVVLVTGAGRGIGRAIALAFAAEGACAAVNDLNPAGAEATVDLIRRSGGQARTWIADVANKLAIQTMAQEILEAWGRIDVLVNNAGVEPHQPILTMDEWEWDRTLDVNLKGPFLLTQYVG